MSPGRNCGICGEIIRHEEQCVSDTTAADCGYMEMRFGGSSAKIAPFVAAVVISTAITTTTVATTITVTMTTMMLTTDDRPRFLGIISW